jgi:hypothetical protein
MKAVSITLFLICLIVSTLRTSADEQAERLFMEVSDTYKATQTLTGNFTFRNLQQ